MHPGIAGIEQPNSIRLTTSRKPMPTPSALIGYHSVNKRGRPNEDRFRILGGGWVQPDERPSAFGERRQGQVIAVMDGIGGAPQGMAAAQAVADRLVELYRAERDLCEEWILALLDDLNREIHAWGLMEGSSRPLGATTLTLAWLTHAAELRLYHIGDSSAYLLQRGAIRLLTTDHSNGRDLERYLGQGEGFVVDRLAVHFTPDDTLCLVTDGVTKRVNKHRIEAILNAYAGEPGLAARMLVEHAVRTGVQDDVTAVVLELAEDAA